MIWKFVEQIQNNSYYLYSDRMNDQNMPLLNEENNNSQQSVKMDFQSNPLDLDRIFIYNNFNKQINNLETQKKL